MQRITDLICISCLALFFFASCGTDKNPVSPNDAANLGNGCVVKQGDVQVVRAEGDSVTNNFFVQENTQSPLLSLYLIDSKGKEFQPEAQEYLLMWQSQNPGVADVVQYQTDGAWNFHVKGFDMGTTSVVLKILKGQEEKFVSAPLPVQVTENSGGLAK